MPQLRFLPLVCTFLLGFFSPSLRAQTSVYGRVVNQGEPSPIIGARIFLAGTVIGDITSNSGTFQLKNIQPGTYQLVVSSLGYRLYKQNIVIAASPHKDSLIISLEAQPIKTGEVEVTAHRLLNYRAKVQEFIRLILGSSPNGQEAKLLNPDALDVSFVAADNGLPCYNISAREPLVILNRRLGYKTTFFLEKGGLAGEKSWFQGPIYFEELPTKDSVQSLQWQVNRLKTSRGSIKHFLYTLIHAPLSGQKSDYQGFKARRINDENMYLKDWISVGSVLMLDSIPVLKDSIGIGYKIFFPYCFEVSYSKILPESSYVNFFRQTAFDDSVVKQGFGQYRSLATMQKVFVRVDEKGFLYSPDELVLYGYWAWQRLADEVPLPYYAQ